MSILWIMGVASAGAIVAPVLWFLYSLYREAFSPSFVVLDEHGKVLGEISADSVQHDPKELAELHLRIRRSEHVSIRAAA